MRVVDAEAEMGITLDEETQKEYAKSLVIEATERGRQQGLREAREEMDALLYRDGTDQEHQAVSVCIKIIDSLLSQQEEK